MSIFDWLRGYRVIARFAVEIPTWKFQRATDRAWFDWYRNKPRWARNWWHERLRDRGVIVDAAGDPKK